MATPGNPVIGFCEEALKDAVEIVVCLALIRAQNERGVNKNLSTLGASNAAMAIRNALITRLVMLVSRAYAESREGDRHFQRAVDLLKKADVRAEFKDSESEIADAEKYWNKCRGDHRVAQLKTLRDKSTAHLGDAQGPVPSYKDLFEISNLTVDAIEMLAFAVGIKGPPVRENIDASDIARRFWKPWMDDDSISPKN